MMAASESGVSITRSGPNRSNRPCVARNTPPRLPTSSPSTTTASSRSMSASRVRATAWTRFITATAAPRGRRGGAGPASRLLRLAPLLGQVPGRLGVDDVEHPGERRRAGVLGGAGGGGELGVDLLAERRLGPLAPQAAPLEQRPVARQRVALAPGLDLL